MKYIYKYGYLKGSKEAVAVAEAVTKPGFKDIFKNIPPATKIMLFSALVAPIAASAANSFVEGIKNYLTRKAAAAKEPGYYKKMLKAHPQLIDYDPEHVAAMWSSLYYHAPNLAEDPIAAGAFLRQTLQKGLMSDYGGPSVDTYNTLTQINERLSRLPGKVKQENKEVVEHHIKNFTAQFAKRVNEPSMQEIMTNPEFQGDNVPYAKKLVMDYLKRQGTLNSWLS